MDASFLAPDDPTKDVQGAVIAEAQRSSISVLTLGGLLIGRREAILKIASTPSAIGAMAILVFTAGLARNYDKPILWQQPWRLVGPFVASLVTSGLLFVFILMCAEFRKMRVPSIPRAYLAFLTIYWTTAPLAWLYGIPVEKMLSPFQATQANIWILAIVSAWRVAIIVRATSLMIGLRALAVFPVLMVVLDAIAWSAIVYSPVPLIVVMSGGELAPETRLISDVAKAVLMLTTFSFPFWLISAVFVIVKEWRPVWSVPEPSSPRPRTRGLYAFAVASLVVWVALTLAMHRS